MTTYLVTGSLRYREHDPGETFEATLDPDVEARAVARGALFIIDSSPTRLRPGSWRLPPDGRTSHTLDDDAPQGAFPLKGAAE